MYRSVMPCCGEEPERVAAGRARPTGATGRLLACLLVAGVATLDPWGFAPFGPAKVTTIVVLTLLAGAGVAGRTVRLHPLATGAWLALLGWLGLAALLATDPLHAWIGTPDRRLGWLTWLLLALAFVCGQSLDGDRERRLLARGAAVAAGALGLYVAAEAAGVAPVAVDFARGRLGGTFGQPAYLGAAGALLVPLAAGLAAERSEPRTWRLVAAAAAALGGGAVLLSQTRAAWVGLACAAVPLLPRVGRSSRRRPLAATLALGVALGATLALALATPVADRAASLLDPAAARSRLDEWRVAGAVVAARPLVGHGPEGYRIAFTGAVDAAYARAHGRAVVPDRAHNGALDVAAAGGLPAAAAYLVLLAACLAAAWRAARRGPAWLAGAGAGVIGYAFGQQLLFPVVEIDPLLWAVAGMVVGAGGPRPGLRARVPRAARPVLALAAVLTLAAGALEVAADRNLVAATAASGRWRHEAALAAADRAVALRPDSVRARFVAARVAARGPAITDLDAALDRVEAGLALSPLDPALRGERGALLLERARRSGLPADLRRATEALARLVADDPAHPGHRQRLALALAHAGDRVGAARQRAEARALTQAPGERASSANLPRRLRVYEAWRQPRDPGRTAR